MKILTFLFCCFTLIKVFGQTAYDYEGTFTHFQCDGTPVGSEQICTMIAIDDSLLIVRNFAGIPNNIIGGGVLEDTLIIAMNFTDNSIQSTGQTFNYSVNGNISFSVNNGQIYSDSLRINYTIYTPIGALERCAVYRRGVFLSITEEKDADFLIYPNPVRCTSKLSIVSKETIEVVGLYNSQMDEIAKIYPLQKDCKFNVSDLSSGLYLLRIKCLSGKVIYKRVIID